MCLQSLELTPFGPGFHIQDSNFCIDCNDGQVLMNDYNPYGRRNGFSHISLDCKTHLAVPDMEDWRHCLTIVGSYNGFVCLTDNRSVILVWNPLTRKTKVLPKSPNYSDHEDFDERFDFVTFEVGFCFDANVGDYKVIKVFHLYNCGTGLHGSTNTVFLYSFLGGFWRKLDVSLQLGAIHEWFDGPRMICTPTNCGEKFYHWFTDPCGTFFRYEEDFSYVVLSFDMELEQFKTTEIPYMVYYLNLMGNEDFNIGFFMLKEYVAISALLGGRAPVHEISVLVKVGVKESWIKLIRIGPIIDGKSILNPWREGKLFVKTSKGEVKLCDPFTGEVVVSSNGRPSCHFIEVVTYKPTQLKIVGV